MRRDKNVHKKVGMPGRSAIGKVMKSKTIPESIGYTMNQIMKNVTEKTRKQINGHKLETTIKI